jgi:hypothetical protein
MCFDGCALVKYVLMVAHLRNMFSWLRRATVMGRGPGSIPERQERRQVGRTVGEFVKRETGSLEFLAIGIVDFQKSEIQVIVHVVLLGIGRASGFSSSIQLCQCGEMSLTS